MLAALALPGLQAAAETIPDAASISVDYLHYQDSQPGMDRITVRSPSVTVALPVAGQWLLEAGVVGDHLSGATPRYHTSVSGASRMSDERTGADVRVTRYVGRATVSAGAAYSGENDYHSRALSLSGTLATEDRNTTGGFAIGVSNDVISPVTKTVVGERRHTFEWMATVEQVLTQRDVLKADLSHSRGRGYFSDPYKFVDNRPRERDSTSVLLRWNHAFNDGSALRSSYRWYTDTFGIRAHTLGAEWEKPLAGGWAVTPAVRLYTQSKADFYFDPVYDSNFGAPFPPGYVFGTTALMSADQRMAAFGAATVGLKVAYGFSDGWSVHVKTERYRQTAGLRWGGSGSPGLSRFDAQTWQVGLSKQWR
ncbi:DUF3570 domain-containing protein [Duganella ginsengisoli]|uniref:DUF3570 domain-containing protein n=2 Tax=Pseudoduganella ginsengisoli TaxID=1462440 RepID=A0A6L6Q4F7_9BURK|nr:DUF3570 domain-containing protein [Pseudoduganella ginsengisoli]